MKKRNRKPLTEVSLERARARLNELLWLAPVGEKHNHIWIPHDEIHGFNGLARKRGWLIGVRKEGIVHPHGKTTGVIFLPEFRCKLDHEGNYKDAAVPRPIQQHPVLNAMYENLTQSNTATDMFVEDWMTQVYGGSSWGLEMNSGNYMKHVMPLWESFLTTARNIALENQHAPE